MSGETLSPRADMYLKVQSAKQGFIKGDSTAAEHVDEIVVLAWYWGVAANTDAAFRTQAKRSWRPLVVDKELDLASTKLMSALVTNETLKTAVLAMRLAGAGQKDYTIITLTNALVIDVQLTADPNGHVHERVTFGFQEIDMSFTPSIQGKLGATVTFHDAILGDQ